MHTARAIDAINLGFKPNSSAYIFFIPRRKTLITTNKVQFDEVEFPFWKRRWLGSFYRTMQLIFNFNHLPMSNGFLATRSMLETTRRSIVTKQAMLLRLNTHTPRNYAQVDNWPLKVSTRKSILTSTPGISGMLWKALGSQAWGAAYNSESIGFKKQEYSRWWSLNLESECWIRLPDWNTRRTMANLLSAGLVCVQEVIIRSMESITRKLTSMHRPSRQQKADHLCSKWAQDL